MRIAIFAFAMGKTVASGNIARWLSAYLNVPLYTDGMVLVDGPWDILICVNGPTSWLKDQEALARSVRDAKHIIYVQNDYTCPPPRSEGEAESPLRKAWREKPVQTHYWTTCAANMAATPASSYVNWNMLGFSKDEPMSDVTSETVVYYGSFRNNREHLFDRYFGEPGTDICISSPSKKFQKYSKHCSVVPPFGTLYVGLAGYGAGLYLQDRRSDREFHSPASRFYEMLSVRLPIAFQPEAAKTMAEAGYDVAPFVVRSRDDLGIFMKHRGRIASLQRDLWYRDYRYELAVQVDCALQKFLDWI